MEIVILGSLVTSTPVNLFLVPTGRILGVVPGVGALAPHSETGAAGSRHRVE
jgi:hypothetical protein